MPTKPTSLAEARQFVERVRREARGRRIAEPPEAPLPASCCERGCERCVFVVYYEALMAWRREALGESDRETT